MDINPIADFANWLAQTRISLAIQTHLWIIPTVQSIHIVCIGIVMASVLMIDLRIFGLASGDQTLRQTVRRFSPWLWGALSVLLVTGVVMVAGEPARELLSVSFWLKMCLLAIGIVLAVVFQTTLRRSEKALMDRGMTKVLALATLMVWCSIIVLGRLIAYDHVWGSWSFRS